jgi:hypothetical protein
MDEIITTYVGWDAHAESTAVAVAEAGSAAPRFIGTVGAKFSELSKALGKLGKRGRAVRLCHAATAAPSRLALRGGGTFEDTALTRCADGG